MCPPLDMISQLRAGNFFLDGFRYGRLAFVAFSDDDRRYFDGRQAIRVFD